MFTNQSKRNLPHLLGYSVQLACATAALWLALNVLVPSAQSQAEIRETQVPAFFAQAFHIHDYWFVPIAVVGCVLFVMALLGLGPARLVTASRTALALFSGLVVFLSLYLLSSAGVAFKAVSVDQERERRSYEETLNQFAFLEAAQGRYEKIRQGFLRDRGVKLVEVASVSEYSQVEVQKQITTLMSVFRRSTSVEVKRQMLATLCLFRERVRKDEYELRDLPRLATEAGAPPSDSPIETLAWIAANLNKDGWQPLPLTRLTRPDLPRNRTP